MSTAAWAFVIVAAFLISSLMPLIPNQRQRQQARLREQARQQGLRVTVITPSDNYPESYVHRGMLKYLLPWGRHMPAWQGSGVLFASGVAGEGQWLETGRIAPDCLAQLQTIISSPGPDCALWEFSTTGVAVIWHEKGSEDTIGQIYEKLMALQQVFNQP